MTKVTRRFNELKKTALSMLSEGKTDLPEKIMDSMMEIVREKKKSYKKKRREVLRKRMQRKIKEAEEKAEEKFKAKEEGLKVIQYHIKKREFREARALLGGFYLTQKSKRKRIKRDMETEEETEERETVKKALEQDVPDDVFQELADLMSVGEEEAQMYALELAHGFNKATKQEISAEKAAECYLEFRNWDFRTTWLPVIKESRNK